MKVAEDSRFLCLIPYDPAEGISLSVAARRAGKSESTLRSWCNTHGIGRRVAGGAWVVSQVALAMLLDGDRQALRRYLNGDRESKNVTHYFHRFNLRPIVIPEAVKETENA